MRAAHTVQSRRWVTALAGTSEKPIARWAAALWISFTRQDATWWIAVMAPWAG